MSPVGYLAETLGREASQSPRSLHLLDKLTRKGHIDTNPLSSYLYGSGPT